MIRIVRVVRRHRPRCLCRAVVGSQEAGTPGFGMLATRAAPAETDTAVLARIHRTASRRTRFAIVFVRTPATNQLPKAGPPLGGGIIKAPPRRAPNYRLRLAAVVIGAPS